jgi:hypothetical protein
MRRGGKYIRDGEHSKRVECTAPKVVSQRERAVNTAVSPAPKEPAAAPAPKSKKE